MRSNSCMKSRMSPNQMQLINTLRRLWMEHVMWTRFFIVSTVSNLPDLDSVTKRLLRNPGDFASTLKPLYGNKNAVIFEKLFADHLLIAAKLVNAAKEGNVGSVDEQRKKWYANADELAAFLGNINPHWNQKDWQEMLYKHLKMTENEAVQLLSGKYAESIVQYDSIQEEALKMADNMAYGIIHQFGL